MNDGYFIKNFNSFQAFKSLASTNPSLTQLTKKNMVMNIVYILQPTFMGIIL